MIWLCFDSTPPYVDFYYGARTERLCFHFHISLAMRCLLFFFFVYANQHHQFVIDKQQHYQFEIDKQDKQQHQQQRLLLQQQEEETETPATTWSRSKIVKQFNPPKHLFDIDQPYQFYWAQINKTEGEKKRHRRRETNDIEFSHLHLQYPQVE